MVAISVVLAILLLALADSVLERVEARRSAGAASVAATSRTPAAAEAPAPPPVVALVTSSPHPVDVPVGAPVSGRPPGGSRGCPAGLPLPGGVFVHPGHVWALIEASGEVRAGLDGFACRAAGRPDRVNLRKRGDRLVQGEPMVELEWSGRKLVLPAPLSGTIDEVNEAFTVRPGMTAEDLCQQSWVCRLTPSSLGCEIGRLRVAETARAWLDKEAASFAEWIARSGPASSVAVMPDGGTPIPGALVHTADPVWEEFQRQFLPCRLGAVDAGIGGPEDVGTGDER